MDIILYGLIFAIGALFGSFFTLAVYRIPLGEDILYKHSFCPNCNEKLQFKELIPIISYLCLRGKCAHCGQKIRIRYLLLEILSGMVFLLFALSLKLGVLNLSTNLIVYFLLFILYIASLFIIAGIDKERITIQKELLVFGIVLIFAYMTYVCIQNSEAIYTYIIYLTVVILLLVADTVFIKKKLKESYLIENLMLVLYMVIFSGPFIAYMTIVTALLCIGIGELIRKIKEKVKSKVITKVHDDKIRVPIGFYLCISNILLMIVYNFLCNWVI